MSADTFDISSAIIRNSPDVRAWPATADLTRLEFRPTGVHVEHTKNLGPGAWPNFTPPGWDGQLQYTLWIFFSHGAQVFGSGCIQFWQSCDQNGGPPEQFAANWYYAADRWPGMTGYQPQPGERVGFMVSAGDARNSGIVSVQERSACVAVPFPSSGAVWVAVPGVQFPPEQPEPGQPPSPPAPPPASDALADIRNEIILTKLAAVTYEQQSEARHGETATMMAGLETQLTAIQAQLARGFTNRLVGDVKPK